MKSHQMNYIRFTILAGLLVFINFAFGQQEVSVVKGVITDEKQKPLDLVNISIMGLPGGTVSDTKGKYLIEVPSDTPFTLVFSFVGYEKQEVAIILGKGETKTINRVMISSSETLPDIVIQDERIRSTNLQRINPKEVTVIPSASGSIESLIKTLPGVASNNELSSQYSVRGGNFDENLVYVDDIEIYRPFLIRSGQQEGMSFINPDLTSSILFSAGGFDAKYGDKMSSVLDIRYKRPAEFAGSVSVSLLGATAHVEGASKNQNFSYLLGLRYKTNQYLLNALETKGDYQPSFFDVQTLLRYDITKKLEISFLGNFADNKFNFVPETRETKFGTISQVKQLTIYFDGQEVDKYKTYLGALRLNYKPQKETQLKFIGSVFNSDESETFDVQGQYWIGEVETGLGDNDFGEVVGTLGVGTFLNHARNYLNATVISAEHKGSYEKSKNYFTWGIKYQHEDIEDRMSEWDLLDSAGYTLPRPADNPGVDNPAVSALQLNTWVKSKINLTTNRYMGFVQNTHEFGHNDKNLSLTFGLRANYWDKNEQFIVSPRASMSYQPNWTNDVLFRLAAGYYYQPPFYRELRNFDGTMNYDQKAQKSIHLVAGSDWDLLIWGRPFKFVTEVYYKFLDNLIPYEVDNVRIRYFADQTAKGYATGIDLKINGEFVPGIESWASMSWMKTEEDINGDYYYNDDNEKIEPGFIPRPTDQRFRFSMFFQDYLPMNPTYKVHLALYFGSSLPVGPPKSPKYAHTKRMPTYRRVDIGFSKQIIGEHSTLSAKNPFHHLKSLWISFEVFNLLDINNTISYIWVTDVSGVEWAVPNYLTPRQLNLKLVTQF